MKKQSAAVVILGMLATTPVHAEQYITPVPPPQNPPPAEAAAPGQEGGKAVIRHEPDTAGILTVSFENDIFAGTDNHYTNGLRIAYVPGENRVPSFLENTIGALPIFPAEARKRWQFTVGQSMFTPEDIRRSTPDPTDRPYAGWLYGGVGVVSDTGYQLDNLQLTLGVIGPASGAAEAQKLVHRIIRSQDPKGWGHQLRNEPGVIITYERKWRGLYEFSPFGMAVDFTPSAGIALGNIYTHGAVGAVMRIGRDLPSDYGPPLIRPNLPGSDFFVPTRQFGWYLFAGLEGRAVARNIFLDGNTFRDDSPHVDKYPLVGGVQAGAALTFNALRVAYTHVVRTREFRGQPHPDMFGAVTLSYRF